MSEATGYVLRYLVIRLVALAILAAAGLALAPQHQLVATVQPGAGLMIQIRRLNAVLVIMVGKARSLLTVVTHLGKEKIATLAPCVVGMAAAMLQIQYYATITYHTNYL